MNGQRTIAGGRGFAALIAFVAFFDVVNISIDPHSYLAWGGLGLTVVIALTGWWALTRTPTRRAPST